MQIRGAAQHNLQNLDLDLPDRALIVLTGVSGSGKTSLATHTILAESRRRMREALPEQRRAARSPPPLVEEITGLPPALGLSAATRPRALELLADRCDLLPSLRRLWARDGVPCCPGCGRAIRRLGVDAICRAVEGAIQQAIQQASQRSLRAGDRGGRLILLAPILRAKTGRVQPVLEELQRAGFARVRLDGAVQEIAEVGPVDARLPHTLEVVVDRVRLEAGRDPAQRAAAAAARAERLRESVALGLKVGKGSISVEIDGQATVWSSRLRCDACDRALIAPSEALLSHTHRRGACPACRGAGCATCGGERLCPEGRAVRLEAGGAGGPSLPEALRWTVEEARSRAGSFPEGRLSAQIRAHLGELIRLGLGGVALGAPVAGLSRSIQQRARLGALLGRPLAGALYVLEEPTAGLAAAEIPAIIGLMRGLVAAGCTVIATDHALPLIRAADHVVELGPGAGPEGGRLLFEGRPEALAGQDTPTGRALSGRLSLTRARQALDRPAWVQAGGRAIPIQSGRITGIAGEGGLLDEVERQIRAGQAPLLSGWAVRRADPPAGQHGSARSMVATIAGVWPLIRRLLAHTREAQRLGFGPERFGLHAGGGRCPECRGRGRVEDQVCAACEGGRFDEATRSVRWRGRSAADLLALSVAGARTLFQNQPGMAPLLARIAQAGLGYLPLGMGGDQLSGGERQRLRLARALAGPGEAALWLLEEPSAGLHAQDLRLLLDVLEPVAEAGGAILLTDRSGALLEACDICVPAYDINL